jgi:biuret amidohydrolase
MELDPATTAVLTMELQRGVCGDLASMPALRAAVIERDVETNTARLLAAARSAGSVVGHCTFSLRPDRAGTDMTLPMMWAARKNADYLLMGTESVEVLPALGPEPSDLNFDRHHGVSPFGGTTLDAELKVRNVATVVVTGVSLNVGIIGTAVEAVNAGFRVIIPRDAVVGLPLAYGDSVLDNAIIAMATVSSVDELVEALSPTR